MALKFIGSGYGAKVNTFEIKNVEDIETISTEFSRDEFQGNMNLNEVIINVSSSLEVFLKLTTALSHHQIGAPVWKVKRYYINFEGIEALHNRCYTMNYNGSTGERIPVDFFLLPEPLLLEEQVARIWNQLSDQFRLITLSYGEGVDSFCIKSTGKEARLEMKTITVISKEIEKSQLSFIRATEPKEVKVSFAVLGSRRRNAKVFIQHVALRHISWLHLKKLRLELGFFAEERRSGILSYLIKWKPTEVEFLKTDKIFYILLLFAWDNVEVISFAQKHLFRRSTPLLKALVAKRIRVNKDQNICFDARVRPRLAKTRAFALSVAS